MSTMQASPDWGLKDKVVIVTGAGRGIGKSCATELAKAGAKVMLTFTGSTPESEARAKALSEELSTYGNKCLAAKLDVSIEEQIESVVELTQKELGPIYGLVNNAGVAIDGLSMRYKSSDWDRLMNANLKGAFMMSKAVLRSMMKGGGGSIVMMGSVVGQMGNAGQAAYSASKAGLEGLAKSMARELGSRKLRVNVIAPGFIETDMTSGLNEDQKKQLLTGLPLESLGQPEDIAWATMFLLSPLSRYVTGQVLGVNGGLYM